MQLTCIPANLKRALDITVPATVSRATLPILSYVLLKTNERGELQVQGANLQQYVTCTLGARATESGAVAVPARLSSSLVDQLADESSMELRLDEKTLTLHLECGSAQADLKCRDAAEFPAPLDFQSTLTLTCTAGWILKAFEQTYRAVAAKDGQILSDVLAEISIRAFGWLQPKIMFLH